MEKTATVDVPGVELSMEALGALADGAAAETALRPLVAQYRAWIESRRVDHPDAASESSRHSGRTRASSPELPPIGSQQGITLLAQDADALDAFRVANRAVAPGAPQASRYREPRDGAHSSSPSFC